MGHIFKHIQDHILGIFRPGLLPTGTEASGDAPTGAVSWGDGTYVFWGDGTYVEWS